MLIEAVLYDMWFRAEEELIKAEHVRAGKRRGCFDEKNKEQHFTDMPLLLLLYAGSRKLSAAAGCLLQLTDLVLRKSGKL